jgi:hypothetical protein
MLGVPAEVIMTALFVSVVVLLSAFGCASALRILEFHRRFALIRTEEMTKIGTFALLIAGILTQGLHPLSLFEAILIIASVPLIVFIAVRLILRRRWEKIEASLPELLGRIALRMKMGASLRTAAEQIAHERADATQFGWMALLQNVSFSPQGENSVGPIREQFANQQIGASNFSSWDVDWRAWPEFFRELVVEFRSLDQASRDVLKRVELLRAHRMRLRHFRRRSRQVSLQARVQSRVMLIMFVVLSIFMASFVGWQELRSVLPIATFLQLLGQLAFFHIERGMKWSA